MAEDAPAQNTRRNNDGVILGPEHVAGGHRGNADGVVDDAGAAAASPDRTPPPTTHAGATATNLTPADLPNPPDRSGTINSPLSSIHSPNKSVPTENANTSLDAFSRHSISDASPSRLSRGNVMARIGAIDARTASRREQPPLDSTITNATMPVNIMLTRRETLGRKGSSKLLNYKLYPLFALAIVLILSSIRQMIQNPLPPLIIFGVYENDSNKTAQLQIKMPRDERILLVHVGKAGGVTLYDILKAKMKSNTVQCRMNATAAGQDDNLCWHPLPNESQLSLHLIAKTHLQWAARSKEEKDWLLQNTNTFLFTVRDPLDRLISAFNYHKDYFKDSTERKDYKKFYYDCFDSSFSNMIDTIQSNNGTDPSSCRQIGVNVLKAKGPAWGWHFNMGYQYYKRCTIEKYPNHSVAVIRTEFMWEDIIQTDKILGGTGNFTEAGHKYTHGSEKYRDKLQLSTDLSPSNAEYLCCLVYEEISVYQWLILNATNLNDTQKHETLSSLYKHCQLNDDDQLRYLDGPHVSWKKYGTGDDCLEILN